MARIQEKNLFKSTKSYRSAKILSNLVKEKEKKGMKCAKYRTYRTGDIIVPDCFHPLMRVFDLKICAFLTHCSCLCS